MSLNFKSVFEQMQIALRRNPSAARACFKAATRQISGLRSQATIRQFELDVDEPPALAGTDQGPNPVELILAALGTCQEITYRLYAEKMGIELHHVAVDIKGDIDLRGFFAVDENTRPGFESIKASVTLDSPASEQELTRLHEAVEAHCPVLDILSKPTPVKVETSRTSVEQLASAVV
ncbi:MAG: OsmC family protein [Proteobacteria bacterium]|nr:OsmC family protein [Pseudomonadota bacterium]